MGSSGQAEKKNYNLYTQQKVYEMMKALDLPLPNEDKPGIDGLNFELYRRLVAEEANEFNEALLELQYAYTHRNYDDEIKYWVEVIDAICDIIVVVYNCSNAMGIDIRPFFDEVHRTNMLKAEGPLDEYGKRLKPPGWKPPEIRRLLEERLERFKDEEQ